MARFGNFFAFCDDVQDYKPNDHAEARAWNHWPVTQQSKSVFQELIQGLREELAECGALLVILDQQQKLILQRQPDALLENAASLDEHTEILAAARTRRRKLSRELAERLGVPGFPSWTELAARSSPPDQWLIQALVVGVNWVLCQCQRRLLQNKVLLGLAQSRNMLIKHRGGLVCFGLN